MSIDFLTDISAITLVFIFIGFFAALFSFFFLLSASKRENIYLLVISVVFATIIISIMTIADFFSDLRSSFLVFCLILEMILLALIVSKKVAFTDNKKNDFLTHTETQNKMMYLQSRYASLGETIGNIAHQWKQPLNAIGAIQNSIKAAVIFQGSIPKDKLLDSVDTSFKLLQHLAETIDTFYSFLTPKNDLGSSFHVSDVFETIRKMTEYSFENNKIKLLFKSDSNPAIQGDANEFTHAILNLILNAKDAFDSSQIDAPVIGIEITGKDNTCIITVSDNAGGIKIKPIEQIFDWHISSKHNSSGVGLYITKNIIEKRFGGTITVENKNSGAYFTIEVPYSEYGEHFTDIDIEEKLSLKRIKQLSQKVIELKELEKDLIKWADIFKYARWGIALHVGKSDLFETTNPAFHALYGYTAEELRNLRIPELFAPESLHILPKVQAEAFENGYATFEAIHKHKDGSYFPVMVELIVIKDDSGEVLYHIANVWDLTEEKKVEELLKLKKFAMDNIQEAIFMADENGDFAYVNDEACRSLGYSSEELLQMNVGDVDPAWPKERWPEFWNMLKIEKTALVEVTHRKKDGTVLPVEVRANYFEYNGVGYNLGFARDITERIQLEAEKENRIIKMVAENSPDVIIRYDVEGRRTYANPKAGELLGVEVGKSPSETTPIIGKELYISELKKVIKTGIEATFEITYINVVGGIDYSHIRMVPEFNDNGNISSVLMIGRNVTDQKQAFDALAQKEKELRALAESSPGMMGAYYMRPDGSVCMPYASPNINELFGITPEEIKEDATPLIALHHPDDTEMIAQTIQESAQKMNLWHIEYRIIHSTKGIRWMEGSTMPQPHPDGGVIWYGHVHDITERKEMELSLEKHRISLANAQKISHIGSWDLDLRTNKLNWSEEYYQILEIEQSNPDDVAASFETLLSIIHPDDREYVIQSFTEWQTTMEPYNTEHRLLMSDGRIKYIQQLGGLIYDSNGHPLYAMGTIQDITERKEMEQEIKNANDRYIQILDNSIDVIYLIEVTLEGHFIYVDVNAAYEEVTGISRDVVIGLDVKDIEDETFRTILIDKFTTCLNAGEKTDYTADYPFPAGLRTFHSVLLPIRDESGRIVRIVGSARDITERKEMEEALKISEQKFRTLIENATDNIARYDTHARIIYMNPQLEMMLGMSYGGIIGKTPTEGRDDDIYTQYEIELKKVIATGENAQVYITLPDEGNGEQYHYIQIVAERDINNNIIGAIAFGRDVTELTNKTIELQKSLEFNEGIIAAIPDLLFEIAPDGTYIGVWAQNEETLVAQRELLLGKNFKEILPPDVVITSLQTMKEVDEKGFSLGRTYSLNLPDGKKWFELSVTKKRTSGNYIVLSRDITERKELETLLEKERKFLLDAQRVAHTGSWYLDIKNDLLSWSDETYRIFELNKENIDNLHKTFYECVHPDDREMVSAPYLESVKTGVPYQVEHRIVMSDGRIKYVIESCEHVYDNDAKPLYSIGTVQDITERKLLEKEIADSYNFLNMLIDSIPDPIFVKDRYHTWTLLNKAFCELIGQPKDVLIGKSDYDFFPKEQADIFWEKDEVVYKSGNINVNDEFFTSSDGTVHFIQTVKTMFTSANGESHLVGSIRDLTERKMMEEKLRRSEASLNEAQKIAKMGSWELDIASETLTWSDETYRIFELKPEQITDLHKTFYESVHPDEREMVNSLYMESVKTKLPFEVDHRIVMPDGRIKYVLETCETQYDKDGNPILSIGTVLDITERKLAENTIKALNETLETKVQERTAELQKALAFNKGVINAIPDLLFEVDKKGTYLNVWAKNEELLVAQKELLLGKKISDILSEEATAIAMSAIKESDENGLSFGKTLKIDLPQGTHWFELSSSKKPDGNFILISRDVTERKIAEVELREREETFRAMVENSPDVIIRYDLQGHRTYINPIGQTLMNRPLEELIGKTPEEYSILPDTTEFRKLFSKVITQGEEINLEAPYKMPDGEIRWGEQRIVPEKNAQGEVTNVLVIGRDLTERKNLESLQKERLALEERLSKIVASAPEVNYIFEKRPDNTVHFTYLAPGFEELFGLSADAALNDFNIVMEHIHSDDRETIRQSIVITTRDLTDWHEEFRINHTKKGVVWIEGQSSPELQTDGTIIWYGFFHNITERKEAKKRLELIDSAINSSKEAIYINDKDLSIIYVNDGACEMLGYTREKLTSMKIYEIDAHFTTDQIFELRDQTIDVNNAFFETKHRTKDGRILDVEIVGNPFIFDGIDVLVSVVKDISYRKTTEKQLKLLETAINHASEAVYIIGDERSILYASEGASKMLDYTRDELTEMYIYDIDAQMSKSEIDLIKEKTLADGKTVFQTKHKTKKGDLIDVEITSSMFDFDNNLRISIVKKL